VSGLKIGVDKPSDSFKILRLTGEFEGMAVIESKDALLAHLAEPGLKELVADFAEISYIDSAAIGVLLELAKSAQKMKIRFGLLNVPEAIKKVIVMTKVDKVIPIY
jgi:anti-anti-sigma factor